MGQRGAQEARWQAGRTEYFLEKLERRLRSCHRDLASLVDESQWLRCLRCLADLQGRDWQYYRCLADLQGRDWQYYRCLADLQGRDWQYYWCLADLQGRDWLCKLPEPLAKSLPYLDRDLGSR